MIYLYFDVITGLLITGGEKPTKKQLKTIIKDDWLIAAADSGLDWAVDSGFDVYFCVGDMDSLKDPSVLDTMDSDRIFRFPEDKDDTDTEIGIRMLRERGCEKIVLWGAGGGRMDHFLAVYSLFDREDAPDEWYTAREHMVKIDGGYRSGNMGGKRISLFPLGTEICRMKSRGLKWPLDELIWQKGDFGISNIVEGILEIEMVSGKLMMISDIGVENRP